MKKILCILFVLSGALYANAQSNSDMKYTRSSLYQLLVEHMELKFGAEISTVFSNCSIPSRFDDHTLSVRSIKTPQLADMRPLLERFIRNEQVAKRLVSKWYMRQPQMGCFQMDTIFARGTFGATAIDWNLAKEDVRKSAAIREAGMELIGSTYMVVHDIKYVDKSDKAGIATDFFSIAGAFSESFVKGAKSGAPNAATAKAEAWGQLASGIADLGGAISKEIEGFKVTVTSYLYRLNFGKEQQSLIENMYYTDVPDVKKKQAYENDTTSFKLSFVGTTEVKSGNISIMGTKTKEELIRKVLIRATDKSLVELQRVYNDFKIKTPVLKVEEKKLYAAIGLREGVDAKRTYEVLMRSELPDGRIEYKRIGVVKPTSAKTIWDNQYLANAEESKMANLGMTEFVKVSGDDFAQGMLLREMKKK